MTIGVVLLIAALICFLLAAFGVSTRVGLTDLGLAFVVIYMLLGNLG